MAVQLPARILSSSTPYPDLSLEDRDDGVAVLSLHPQGELVTSALLAALDASLGDIERMADEGRVRALVLRSARKGVFMIGSDLDEIVRLRTAAEASEKARAGQRVLRRLERLTIPTVAAIDGPCLETGLELALACGYRMASSSERTRLGLLHVRIGITPAFGGTVRLPRLIGLEAALDLILTSSTITPREGRRLGLVDEVVHPDDLDRQAIRFALDRAEKGRRRSGARRRMARRLLEDTAPGRRLIFRRAARRLREAGPEQAPAARLALEMLAESMTSSLDTAFEREAQLVGHLLVSEPARALIHAYRTDRSTRRYPGSSGVPRSAAVLGAGDVGVDLAYSLISAGIPARVRDRRRETLALGLRRVLSRIAEARLSDTITEEEADRRGARLSRGSGFGGFGALDLVVAAEGEGEAWVRAALREAADHTREGCLLAFASPLLSATEVQREISRAQRVLGFHPALPGARFPLIEVSVGEETAADAVAAAVSLVRRLGRVPLVVPAGSATPATRLLTAYVSEALHLLATGVGPAEIDRAAESFGFGWGPFRRIDALGVERAGRYLRHVEPEGGTPLEILDRAAATGGFYLRGPEGERSQNPALSFREPPATTEHLEPIRRRLLLRLLNEAAGLLELERVRQPADVDLISLAGLGFPRLRGGLLFHAGRVGIGRILAEMQAQAARHGERFAPSPFLERLAVADLGFYPAEASSGQGTDTVLS